MSYTCRIYAYFLYACSLPLTLPLPTRRTHSLAPFSGEAPTAAFLHYIYIYIYTVKPTLLNLLTAGNTTNSQKSVPQYIY